jgi:cold shock CspA family protein
MDSQAMCDRMKQICIDNGLPIWEYKKAFGFIENCIFTQSDDDKDFWVMISEINVKRYKKNKQEVTETEFLQLLKEYNDERL